MSEPTSDALFGDDGTWSPKPLPDPQTGLGRGTSRDAPELPPISLPPIPDASALREAIAAALGDDVGAPPGAVEQDPTAVPDVNAPDVLKADVPKADVPKADVPMTNVAAPPHAAPPHAAAPAGAPAGAPTGRPAPAKAGDRSSPHQPLVSALIPPAPSRPRRPVGPRYRPPMAGASRESGPGADLRRRIRRERVDLPLRSRSDGGATAFFLAVLIIIALLVYYIIISFLDSISRFLP